jgi:DNA-binding MarR family transcriptional regulator
LLPSQGDENIASNLKDVAKDEAPAERDSEINGWNYPGLDFSTFRLVLVAKAIDRLTLKMLADNCDLTIAEWRVLSRLAPAANGATVREISQMAWVDRAEVSRAATALEAGGYTSRRPNPNDGRSPILFITEEGQALYRRLLPIRADFHRTLASDLTDAERAQLDSLLYRIAKKVADLTDEAGG